MSWSLTKKEEKSYLTPDLYEQITDDVRVWMVIELTTITPQMVDGKQTNALLNFITFDLHALVTDQGFKHMYSLLSGKGTLQTVMVRLKSLVCDLYIKYGDKIIDELRQRIYQSITNSYGLTFDIENDLDVNNTFWLYPIMLRVYNQTKLKGQ